MWYQLELNLISVFFVNTFPIKNTCKDITIEYSITYKSVVVSSEWREFLNSGRSQRVQNMSQKEQKF